MGDFIGIGLLINSEGVSKGCANEFTVFIGY